MLSRRTLACALCAFLALSVFPTLASADVILDTGLQQPMFGWVGYDIYPDQSVGIAFKPAGDYTLDSVGVWFMSNDFDAPGRTYTLKLVTDASAGGTFTIPNTANVLESWSMSTNGQGWSPVLDQANSVLHPLLSAGVAYWIVAESTEPAGLDPLWTQAGNAVAYYSAINNSFNPNGWEGGESFGSTPATVISATPIPEPASAAFLLLAAAALYRQRA